MQDQYINHIMNETGAVVILRGRGSGNLENFSTEEAQQPLHLYLSSTNPKSLEAARILAENLLDTISAEYGASRISSCKVYSAVPPPQQLLYGVQSSGKALGVNANPVASLPCTAAGSMPLMPSPVPNGSTGTNPPGSMLHCGDVPNYGVPQPSYPYPSVTGGTYYSGYGGIYPQATPLQQVALALRKAPAPASPDLASTVCATTSLVSTASAVSMSSKTTSSSIAISEKRPPQRRKFQELPVTSKETITHHQVRLHIVPIKVYYEGKGINHV